MASDEGNLRRAATFLAALGVGIAAYIAVESAGGDWPLCVGGSEGCRTVAESSHSELLGIDVALLGVAGYLLLLGAAIARGDGARMAGFVLALVGFGYSVYLTWLELFVIDAICQWCVASAVVMTLLFAVNATRMTRFAGAPP